MILCATCLKFHRCEEICNEEMIRLNTGMMSLTEFEQKLVEAIQYLKAERERLKK